MLFLYQCGQTLGHNAVEHQTPLKNSLFSTTNEKQREMRVEFQFLIREILHLEYVMSDQLLTYQLENITALLRIMDR